MFNEFQPQCTIAVPTIVGLIFYKIPWIVSLHFVGTLGPDALAAAALATTLCNITGMSASVGLSSALMTLAGQARGQSLQQSRERQNQAEKEIMISNHMNENSNLPPLSTNKHEDMNADTKTCEISPLLSNGHTEVINIKFSNILHVYTSSNHDSVSDEDLPLLPLVFLYRGLMVSFAIALPIGLWWMSGTYKFLLLLGQSEEISKMTSEYLQILVPGFWSYSINWTTNSWLQSIDMANVPAFSALIGLLLHIPTNIFFVNILGLGYKGVAMATVVFQVLQTLMVYSYLFGSREGRNRILESIGARAIGRNSLYSRSEMKMGLFSFQGAMQYLELGIPGMIAITEWWASECCIFLAGTMKPFPDYALGAMSIYQSINTFCFIFPIGFSTASSARVGMFLGENQPSDATSSAWIGLFLTSTISLIISTILFFTPHTTFPSLFTSDDHVLVQCAHTIPFLVFYVIADGIQCGLQGAIKGCGKQCIMAPIVLFSYWICAVPLSYYNTFIRYDGDMDCASKGLCGVRGLVFGLLIGTWIHMLLLLGVFVFTIDWKKESALAQERLANAQRYNEEL